MDLRERTLFFFFLMFYEAHGEKTGHCNVWCSKSVFVEACIVTDFQNKMMVI